ncbi:hypothetical protein BYT27DRAFT_7148099 [Phlegmacium glaucopus]|nr:hypothetical protein BYT27DRAFT_7148099 [Phlegmacium glaucopus]
MTSSNGGSVVNQAFEKALQNHLDQWKSDPRSFPLCATLEDLRSEVEEHGNNYRKTRVSSYTSKLSKLIDRFEGFFTVVDTFVSSNPTIAALVWGGFRFIIRIVSEYSKFFERIMNSLEAIGQKLYFYQRYATAIYKHSDRVMTTLADVYGDILTSFMTIKKIFINSKNCIRNSYMIPIQIYRFGSVFEGVIKSLDDRHTLLNAEVEHADRETNYADREEHAIDKWRKQMDHLQSLLRFNGSECGEKHEQSKNKAFPSSGPGTWLLGQYEYQEWRDSQSVESGRLFWLHGLPGSGKTVLTSIVIEDLKRNKRPGSILAIFYCDYKFDEKTQTDYILRSLLEQLLHSFDGSLQAAPPVVHEVLAEFSTARSVTEIPLTDVIIRLANGCEDVTVVIDALDECQDRRKILTLLRQPPSSVRLFVTSRNEDDIRRSFRSYPELWEQEVRPDDVASDIRNYIVRTLDDHLLEFPNFADRSLIHTIIDTLVEKANGMFLWVYFQVTNILECDTNDDIRDTLHNLPKGLEETFIRCLKQIDRHSSKDRLRRLLHLVVCYGSIGIDDLVSLINIDEMDDHWSRQRTINDVSALISRCSHLISTIDFMGQLSFTLSHLSVYHFLSSDPQSFDSAVRTLPQYHFYPIFDAYMAIANTFGRSHHIDGAPELLGAKAQFIQSFHWHPNFLPRAAELLTTMFNAPLMENMQPSLVFPNATHVKIINSRFFSALDEYYILTSQTSAKFSRGPYFWTDVFPHPLIELTIGDECRLVDATLGIHIQPDHRGGTRPVEDFFPTEQTHVTLEDLDFIWARTNNWTIHPSVGIIRNKTTIRAMFPAPTSYRIEGGNFDSITGGDICIHHGTQMSPVNHWIAP